MARVAIMESKLELVAIPVTDVDSAKAFYVGKCGFNADHDVVGNPELRFVQVPPPGSAGSISTAIGLTDAEPGSTRGMQMVVADADEAKAFYNGRGLQVG